jgi:hypothetical protein
MTLLEQLAQPQNPPVPVGFPLSDFTVNSGLLGNRSIQIHQTFADADNLTANLRRLLTLARPALKLALLKRQKFTPEGREQRIAASLAALNAQQPTELTLAQWKAIVEEVEDED